MYEVAAVFINGKPVPMNEWFIENADGRLTGRRAGERIDVSPALFSCMDGNPGRAKNAQRGLRGGKADPCRLSERLSGEAGR